METMKLLRRYLRMPVLILQCSLFLNTLHAQETGTPSQWHKLDYQKDSIYGISWEFAMFLLQQLPSPSPVIVAVIDSGIDTNHIVFHNMLWTNPHEKGRDEDGNGLAGDYHGWNFLGNRSGQNLNDAGLEYKRMYFEGKAKWTAINEKELAASEQKQYIQWAKARHKFLQDSTIAMDIKKMQLEMAVSNDSIVRSLLGKTVYKLADLSALSPAAHQQAAVAEMKRVLAWDQQQTNLEYLGSIRAAVQPDSTFIIDPNRLRQSLVGDSSNDLSDSFYGNNDLTNGKRAEHGTHVSGIIAGSAFEGMDQVGINRYVRIMSLRVVPPDGDEHDKDVALAIRYAVDNGAKVINMSFGKYFSRHPEWVSEALAYAAKKDVLVVKGAGNDHQDVNQFAFYPLATTNRNKTLKNVITVGASGPTKEELVAPFSNYGKAVDLFAPGMNILSALPNNLVEPRSGTSMASPVVAGIASVLRAYFPSLTAAEVKIILMQSVQKIDYKVLLPGTEKKVPFKSLCKAAGIANLAGAVQLALAVQKSK